MRWSRFFLWGLVAAIAAMVVLPMVLMIIGYGLTWGLPLWALFTLLPILLYMAVGFICALAYEAGRAPRLMRSGFVMGALALAGWLSLGWIQPEGGPLRWSTVLLAPTMWSLLMAACGLLLMIRPRDRRWRIMRRWTIVSLSILAAYVVLVSLFYPDWDGRTIVFALFDGEHLAAMLFSWPMFAALVLGALALALGGSGGRLRLKRLRLVVIALLLAGAVFVGGVALEYAGAYSTDGDQLYIHQSGGWWEQQSYAEITSKFGLAIGAIAIGGFVLTLLSALMMRGRGDEPRDLTTVPYWVRCPRCEWEHDAMTGRHHCPRCGLGIRVELS